MAWSKSAIERSWISKKYICRKSSSKYGVTLKELVDAGIEGGRVDGWLLVDERGVGRAREEREIKVRAELDDGRESLGGGGGALGVSGGAGEDARGGDALLVVDHGEAEEEAAGAGVAVWGAAHGDVRGIARGAARGRAQTPEEDRTGAGENERKNL